jgi:hypothetical protein
MARGAAAERGKAGERLGGDVIGEHVMAGLEEIGGHAEAHLAQPDESDGACGCRHGYATSTSSSASRLGPSIITARVSPSG